MKQGLSLQFVKYLPACIFGLRLSCLPEWPKFFVLVLVQIHRLSVFMVIPVRKFYWNIKTSKYCFCCKKFDWNYHRELKERISGHNCVQSCSFGLHEGWQPFGYMLVPAKGRVFHSSLSYWRLGANLKASLARSSASVISNKKQKFC